MCNIGSGLRQNFEEWQVQISAYADIFEEIHLKK